jgi:hypothetical protein
MKAASKRTPLPDNSNCVIKSRKGKYIRMCPSCKLALGTLDRVKGELVCPRCEKACEDISKEKR